MLAAKYELVICVEGSELARQALEPGTYFIGRDPECEISIESNDLSRRHAKVTISESECIFEDLGSSNGTFVDGLHISEPTPISPGSEVRLGSVLLELVVIPLESVESVVPRTYAAFLSYRHADNHEPGRQWASWLQETIETYEVPTDLTGTVNDRGEEIPARIFPVFRDEDELSAAADLSTSVVRALENSRYLVVLCSPSAVASRFVYDEVLRFKAMGKSDRVIAAIVSGEPYAATDAAKQAVGWKPEHECFPEPLRYVVAADGSLSDFPAEPIAADFRLDDCSEGWTSPDAYRENLKGKNLTPREIDHKVAVYAKRLNLMKLKILAGILGVPLGMLTKRDQVHQNELAQLRTRAKRRWVSALTVLGMVAIAGSTIAWLKQKEADQTKMEAEGRVRDISKTAGKDRQTAAEMRKVADEAQKLADEARRAADEASRKMQAANKDAEIAAQNSQYEVALKEQKLGEAQLAADNLEAANNAFRNCLKAIETLAEVNPNDVDLQRALARSYDGLGDVALAKGDPKSARESIQKSLKIGQQLALSDAGDIQAKRDVSKCYYRLGNVALTEGDLKIAQEMFETYMEAIKVLVKADPTGFITTRELFKGHNRLGTVAITKGDLPSAWQSFGQSLALIDRLAQANPGDSGMQHDLALTHIQLGNVATSEKSFDAALAAFEKAFQLAQELVLHDPAHVLLQRDLCNSYDRLGNAAQSQALSKGEWETAARSFARVRELAQQLLLTRPKDTQVATLLAYAYLHGEEVMSIQGVVANPKLSRWQLLEEGRLSLQKLKEAGRLVTEQEDLLTRIEAAQSATGVQFFSGRPPPSTSTGNKPLPNAEPPSPMGPSTYRFVKGEFSWSEAKSEAEKLGGHLAVITSLEENQKIANIVPAGHFAWLGGQRVNGRWQWVTGELWDGTHWAPQEPGNSETGLEMNPSGFWNDAIDRTPASFRTGISGFVVEYPGRSRNAAAGAINVVRPQTTVDPRGKEAAIITSHLLNTKWTWKNENGIRYFLDNRRVTSSWDKSVSQYEVTGDRAIKWGFDFGGQKHEISIMFDPDFKSFAGTSTFGGKVFGKLIGRIESSDNVR
ncbi:MAG: FHA domain-containing protein [Prosthecobacter sp.]